MLTALEDGKIDVLIAWQPAIGAFLKEDEGLEVIPVPNSRIWGGPEQYAFPMSMGVREGDEATRELLDAVITKHQSELTSILKEHGFRSYDAPPDVAKSNCEEGCTVFN